MNEIKIYKSKSKAVKYILLGTPFFVLPLLDILGYIDMSSEMWLNWACVCFFGLGIMVFVFSLFDKNPKIIINEQGIAERMAFGVLTKNKKTDLFIPWSSIKGAHFKSQDSYSAQGTRIGKEKFIYLTLDEDVIPELNSHAMFPKMNSKISSKDYSISLDLLQNFDAKKLVTLINAMAQADNIQRQKLLMGFEL